MKLVFDVENETNQIIDFIHSSLKGLKKKGAVVGLSGGIDSTTTLYLAIQALKAEKVIAVALPDKDSNPLSLELAKGVAEKLGVEFLIEDLTSALAALGCYEKRDSAVRLLIPEFNPTVDKMKIVLPQDLLSDASFNIFSVIVTKPDGQKLQEQLSPKVLREIVAASNQKQRIRMLMLYHLAEQRDYGVIGTANKNEHDLGFFVKFGDGAADLQPLRHLFKTQVYAIAEYLGVDQRVIQRPPTTDTYSDECSQEEFFYRLPFDLMDSIWDAYEHNAPIDVIASSTGLKPNQVENIIADIVRKQASTDYLRLTPLTLPS